MIEAEAAGAFLALHFFERKEDGQGIDICRPELLPVLLTVFL